MTGMQTPDVARPDIGVPEWAAGMEVEAGDPRVDTSERRGQNFQRCRRIEE